MKFITSMRPAIKYYNLTNSAWEPLVEPWDFLLKVSQYISVQRHLLSMYGSARSQHLLKLLYVSSTGGPK